MALDPITQNCALHLKDLDHVRYIGCLFSAPQDRAALVALHAFDAELARVRDSVSEPMLGEIRLIWWREALDGAEAGNPRRHPVVEALAPAIADKRLNVMALNAMIDAREGGLYDDAVRDLATTQAQIRSLGGTLYRQVINLTGGNEDQLALAEDLGGATAQLSVLAAAHTPLETGMRPSQSVPDFQDVLRTLHEEAFSSAQKGFKAAWTRRQRCALAPALYSFLSAKAFASADFEADASPASVSVPRFILRAWLYSRFGWL